MQYYIAQGPHGGHCGLCAAARRRVHTYGASGGWPVPFGRGEVPLPMKRAIRMRSTSKKKNDADAGAVLRFRAVCLVGWWGNRPRLKVECEKCLRGRQSGRCTHLPAPCPALNGGEGGVAMWRRQAGSSENCFTSCLRDHYSSGRPCTNEKRLHCWLLTCLCSPAAMFRSCGFLLANSQGPTVGVYVERESGRVNQCRQQEGATRWNMTT